MSIAISRPPGTRKAHRFPGAFLYLFRLLGYAHQRGRGPDNTAGPSRPFVVEQKTP